MVYVKLKSKHNGKIFMKRVIYGICVSTQTGTTGEQHRIRRLEIVSGYVKGKTKYSCYFN